MLGANIMHIFFLNNFFITLASFIYFFVKINLANLRSFSSKKDKFLNNVLLKSGNVSGLISFIRTQLFGLVFLLVFVNFGLTTTNSYLLINDFKINLIITLFLFFIFLLTNMKINNEHWLLGAYLSVLTSPFLIVSNELMYTYLMIEINSYLFIFLSITQAFSVNRTQRFSIVNSALINFVLNFLSSLAFFIVVSYTYYSQGGLSLFFEGNVFFIFFLLLKISLGPWLYMGVEIYKGFEFKTLFTYTTIFFLSLLPKFVDIFTLLVNPTFVILYIPLLFFIVFLAYSINNINTVKVFLAYSTSIILGFIVLLLIVCV